MVMASVVAVQCPHVAAILLPASLLAAKTQTLCFFVWLIPSLGRPGVTLHLPLSFCYIFVKSEIAKYVDTPSSAPYVYDYTR